MACVVTVFLFGILSLVYRLRVIRHLVSTERELGEQRALASVTIKMGELGEVSAGIGHELSSPLMALNGRLALVRKALEASPPDLEKALRHVEDSVRASQRMMMIVRALRTFSRNSEDDPMENASLLRIVQDAHEFAGARQRCRGPLPEIMIEISEELKVRCLPSLLMQVITNLLKNAYDAIEEMPRPWIHLEALPVEPGLVELRITDSGNGIPAEIADRIMRPFFSTKPNGKGTGLGLHLSRRFLERQQGEFFLDRTYPHTRFVVRLPRGC
jgi:signal transduction histidine kinase